MMNRNDSPENEEAEAALAARREKRIAKIERVAINILETESPERARHLANQLGSTIQQGKKSDHLERIRIALDSVAKMKPRDEAELMLITQMIATHEAAMDCFGRAMLPEQHFQGYDTSLKHAEKLTAIYARQLEALDKHRGKGKQKITVEHVNVHAGGQAIVGDVNSTRSDTPAQSQKPRVLTVDSAASEDGEKLRKALSAKKAPAAKRPRK